MPKQSLLVADADPRSLRILDVALRKAGFQVGTASDGGEALRRIQRTPHDLVLADVALPGLDGMAFAKAVRADPALEDLPILLMGAAKDPQTRVHALEAGADDFLTKPLLIKDVTTRIRMLLVQKDQQRLAQKGTPAALTGTVGDLGLVDLFQTLEGWKRSGVVLCNWNEKVAEVWVADGQVIDAQMGPLTGEAAFYRLLNWEGGTFRVEFGVLEREPRIDVGTQGLLLEAMRRVDEIGRIAETLPLHTRLTVDFNELALRLADLPDEVNGVLRQFDGIRSVSDILEGSPLDELSTLAVLQRLLGEKVLLKAESASKPPSKPSLAQWLGPVSSPPSISTLAPDGPTAPGVPLSMLQAQSDPPVAPLAPVSQPPIPAQAVSVPAPVPTPVIAQGKGKKKGRRAEDISEISQEELIKAFTPKDSPKIESKPPPEVAQALLQVEAAFAMGDAAKAQEQEAFQTGVMAPVSLPPLVEQKTSAFKLPEAPKKAVPIVRFPPLRGVRRERLRKEAEEARAALEGRQPVRLTHVVELPSWPTGHSLAKRRISAAVGEAAKRFAPDVPVASLGDLARARALQPAAVPESAPPAPQLSMKVDLELAESTTSSSKVLEISKETMAAAAAATPGPVLAPAEAPPPAQGTIGAKEQESPWDEITDPNAREKAGELSNDAPTSPGHRVDVPPEEAQAAQVAPAAAVEAAQPQAPLQEPAQAPTAESQAALPVPSEPPPAKKPQIVIDVPDSEDLVGPGEATRPRAAPPDAPAPKPTADNEPEVEAPKKPASLQKPPEDDFDAEMRAALGKGKKTRWPIYAGLAIGLLVLVWFVRPQPKTEEVPWLGSNKPADAEIAPAAQKASPPIATSAPDAAVVAAAPVIAAPPAPAAVVDAGPPAAAVPEGDDYAKDLAAGEALIKRGKYKAAIAELKKASALNPESVPALLELGDAYLEADQPRSAIKPLEKAARLDPKSARAQLLIGTAFQSLGKNADATKAYQKYLELEPTGEYARDVRSILSNLQR